MLSRRTVLTASSAMLLARPAMAQAPQGDDIVAQGWRRDVVIRWGDRVEFDSPPFAPADPGIEAAATQFGWDARVIGLISPPQADDGVERALLAVAHPEVLARMAFPGGRDQPVLAAEMQGASLVNLERRDGRLVVVDGGFQSRRLTATSLCRLSGPAVPRVGDAIQGVLAVAGGAITPWGTLLLAEGDPAPWFARLRDSDDRFPHSAHAAAYGWIAELDALDPQAVPVKRTALGRFPRGGVAATQTRDGRAVVFMTEDSDTGALFRFISAAPPSAAPPSTEGPPALDAGTLSVAVVDGWNLRFVRLPPAATAQLSVLAEARRLNAAAFDRPAGLALGPGGVLYLACRGVPRRARPDALNPRDSNPNGHVLAFRPDASDPAADVFGGEIILLGGDPGQGSGVNQDDSGSVVSRPTGLAVDSAGRLWIAAGSGLAVSGGSDYTLRRVYTPPLGAESGGVAAFGDSIVTAAAHPGALPGASFERPATRWPSLRAGDAPRSTVVEVRRV